MFYQNPSENNQANKNSTINDDLLNPFWLAAVPKESGVISLSWRFNNDSLRIGYNVYRTSPNDYNFKKINKELVTTTSYIDRGLTNGQTYFYIVRAVDVDGFESYDSNEVITNATSESSQFNVYRVIGSELHPAFDDTRHEARANDWRYYSASVSVGDLNGDGYVDFIAWQKGPNANLVAYDHNGTFLWDAPFYIRRDSGAHNCRVVIGDVDSDGKAEVISYDESGGWHLRIRNGMTGALEREMELTPEKNRANVALAELNGNGFRDAIILHHGVQQLNQSHVIAFDGNLNVIWSFDSPHMTSHWIKVEDIDEDGKDEVLLGGRDFIDDDGTRIPVDSPQGAHVDGIAVGDFDWVNPGLEIIFSGCGGGHVWMVNNKGKLMWDHYSGHAHWVTLGDFDPTHEGIEAYITAGEPAKSYIYYADGSRQSVNVMTGGSPTIDWDGDESNGDEIFSIRNHRNNRITNVYTETVLFNPGGRASGNRAVDVTGDFREEYIYPDCKNRRIVIFYNTDYNPNAMLSKWEDSYWRWQSKYKRSFVSEYINGALAY